MNERLVKYAPAIPLLVSLWPFVSAYKRYVEYQYLEDVALPHFQKDPVQSTGIESHNVVASRIENIDMPDVYERLCENLVIGFVLLIIAGAGVIASRKK